MLIFYDNNIYTKANIYNIGRNVRPVTFVDTTKNSYNAVAYFTEHDHW